MQQYLILGYDEFHNSLIKLQDDFAKTAVATNILILLICRIKPVLRFKETSRTLLLLKMVLCSFSLQHTPTLPVGGA